jgi:hypothetical protein
MARAFQLTGRRVMSNAALVATVSTALIALGCRDSVATRPPKAIVDVDPLDQARKAMAQHDYDAATALLRTALARRPDDFEVHYRLGVSTSHLDRVDEATQEFEWVVTHGSPGAPEVQIAHNWLTSRTAAGVPAPSVAAVVSPEAPAQKNPDLAALTGRAIGPEGVKARFQLFLKGLPGTPVQHEYHMLRTDSQGNFRFTDVMPGEYMLTNVIAGPPTWRLRVSLVKGERLVLDLSPSNQAEIRDDFRDLRS